MIYVYNLYIYIYIYMIYVYFKANLARLTDLQTTSSYRVYLQVLVGQLSSMSIQLGLVSRQRVQRVTHKRHVNGWA